MLVHHLRGRFTRPHMANGHVLIKFMPNFTAEQNGFMNLFKIDHFKTTVYSIGTYICMRNNFNLYPTIHSRKAKSAFVEFSVSISTSIQMNNLLCAVVVYCYSSVTE